MATGALNMQADADTIEYNMICLFDKLEEMRRHSRHVSSKMLLPPRAELTTLELWRSIISECLASFFYVFTVCGAAAGVASGGSTAQTVLASAFASGFSIAALTQSFGHISGAHVNPAISIAMMITRNITVLRGLMFVIAQCGGGIAGAALLYGVTLPSKQRTLTATVAFLPVYLSPWERFGLELILTFVVTFTYFVSMDSYRKWIGGTSLSIGSAYLAASIVSMPALNPARALGPAFVMNKWDNHWVFWFGPIIGGISAGLIYEFIFNPKRHYKRSKDSIDGDSSSIHSDEDTYDELEKPRSAYNTLRPLQPGTDVYRPVATQASPTGGQGYCAANMAQANVYGGTSACKVQEPLYGGTKSMYCKSPPLTRANLNRSQSVYSKSTGPPMLHRTENGPPRPGPLVPAQSLYPMRLNSVSSTGTNTVATNQNAQNQQRLGEGIYGTRPLQQSDRIYRKLPGRPESVYGQRTQAPDSGDSTYGSYQSSNGQPTPRGAANYAPVPKPQPVQNYQHHHQQQQTQQQIQQQQQQQQQQMMQQRPQDDLGIPTQNGPAGYMQQRESPNSQYITQRGSPNPQQFVDHQHQRESPQGQPPQGFREVANPTQYLRPESHESASTGY
ncbi:Major intrinsic protein [Nesidiocoris tenuis]|uniref:Major intrinsic protein n=1 Tax=Nesidiocoris tenuis TaxID=355587 RepID=A0ABN7ANN0_9HEMI|nr:Major intrinsic protein [Nesidiocoris tenuis]